MALLHPPTLHPCWAAVNRQHPSTWFQTVVEKVALCTHLVRRCWLGWKKGFTPSTNTTFPMKTCTQSTGSLPCSVPSATAQPTTETPSAACISRESGITGVLSPIPTNFKLWRHHAVEIFPAEQSTDRNPEFTAVTKAQLSSSFSVQAHPRWKALLPSLSRCPPAPGIPGGGWMTRAGAAPG